MKKLIVARYNEDVDWLKEVPSEWEVMIVQKDKDLPNKGREASSYFWAIDKLYPQLKSDDELAFVQGNPFPHIVKDELLNYLSTGIYGVTPFGPVFKCLGNGLPNHMGLPVAEKYEKWLMKPFPGEVKFVAGAQFGVRGSRIKKYKQKYYQLMQKEMSIDENPWTMERMWLELFKKT